MTLPKPKAVIFDWDDTIVDNWGDAFGALNTALESMGHKAWSDDEAKARCGRSAKDLFSEIFGDKWEQADKVYYDTYNKSVSRGKKIFVHAEDILEKLFNEDVYLAVVSNKRGELLREEAVDIGFDSYFKEIIGAGDAKADKPNTAPLYKALGDSGIEPASDVWFVGDSPTDMICALNSGCSAVLLETKLPPEEILAQNPPTKRFEKHEHMLEYINSYF